MGHGDTGSLRKARGAFFTPPALSEYLVAWAIRSPDDDVLEPSCGDAAFLAPAALRTRGLLRGIELHEASASMARGRVPEATIEVADFFTVSPEPGFDAVVGNPPFVRYQGFGGDSRSLAQGAALRAGVALTSLASSWAAFTVHAAMFLRPGGRLALVLPAELLTANYAGPVRSFLLERFGSVRLTLFTERVFPGALVDVVLLMAEGTGPARDCEIAQVHNAADLGHPVIRRWRPTEAGAKWTPSLLPDEALETYESLLADERFTTLDAWGDTTLGMVTGNNRYFALSPGRAAALGLKSDELLRLSPPGSRHLRRLALGRGAWTDLGRAGQATNLFRPSLDPSSAARAYIHEGERTGVHHAYKCRVRSPWWRVPEVPSADLFFTYMNADVPRLCANGAGVHHLNSVHGVYLRPGLDARLLPLAALNSMTMLGAETVGRAYGGGLLKLEPREAARLPIPSADLLAAAAADLLAVRRTAERLLAAGDLPTVAGLVDDVLLMRHAGLTATGRDRLRRAREALHARRVARGAGPRF